MYVYDLGCIDDFSFFTRFTPSNFNSISNCETFKDYDATLVEVTKKLLTHTYWEGDGDFYVIPLLNMDDMFFPGYGIIVKQGNNGSTFMVSNIKAKGLKELRVDKVSRW